jgi:hypothetical protein
VRSNRKVSLASIAKKDMPDNQQMADPETEFRKSPALRFRSKHYPERFNGRVPQLIRPLRTIRPDLPMRGKPALQGTVYFAWTNSFGAVAAVLPDGNLGLKPDEFEVVSWADPADFPLAAQPHG